jgi:Uma2 family endonuclease
MGEAFSLPRRALSVDDFQRMGEVGLFRPDERLELISGELISMSPIGARHANAVNVLTRLLTLGVGMQGVVSIQNPLALPPDSEPQPDLMVLGPHCWGSTVLPSAADVLLLIEVADTSLRYDLDIKFRLYADAGIPNYWVVDVQEPCLFLLQQQVTADPLLTALRAEVDMVLAAIPPA